MNVQSVALDVTKQPQISPVLYLGQGDKNGTTLEAAIYDDGTALTLTGKSARFCMRTPNGAGYYECDGTVSGNTATFLIDETYAATVYGTTDVAYVEILEGSTVICSTNRFRVVVLQNATEDADPNGAYTNGVQRFLDDAADQLEEFEESTVGAIDEARQQVDEAVEEADAATARAIAAAEAAEGIVLQDVPTMSKTVKGGATLGSGLTVDNGALSLGDLTQSASGAEVLTDGCAIYSVDGEGWATQDGTPTPDNPVEIEVARGRNLIPNTATSQTINGVTFTVNPDGSVTANGTASANAAFNIATYFHLDTKTYTLSGNLANTTGISLRISNNVDKSFVQWNSEPVSVKFDSESSRMSIFIYITANTTANNATLYPQLELGTAPTPYVPYGHIGLEVTHDGTTTVTPIPLPSKGFAASLPDGTADALTIDSAGRWEWVNEIARIASYNGESVGNVYMSTTGQLTTGAEVYYKSAQASEHGYIDVPAIPDGSTVSIPELLEIGVAWFVHGAKELVEHATNERKRTEEALADVYEAIADL